RADLRVEAFGPTGLGADSLRVVEDAPGVDVAAPALQKRTYLVPGIDQTQPNPPVTVVGVDPEPEARVRDFVLAAGDPLAGPTAPTALITQTLAASDGLAVGDTVTFLGPDGPADLTVAGILAGDGPIVGTAGRTVILPLATM